MADGILLRGKFFITIYENSEVVSHTEVENKVLKQGLGFLFSGGAINQLSIIKIGSDNSPTSYLQTNLNAPLINNEGEFFSSISGLSDFQYGFINYFPIGVATGEWKEIGAANGNVALFNRAVINPGVPVVKGPFQTAFAGVIFTVGRVTGDD